MRAGSPQDIAIKMLEKLSSKQRLFRILDIGCGNGDVLVQLKRMNIGNELIEMDADNSLLLKAKKRGIITYNINLDGKILPFSDNYFDCILLLDVIEHILDVRKLLKEIKRVLRKGGTLILSTPNVQFIYHIFRLILGYSPKTSFGNSKYFRSDFIDGGHVHYFTEKDLIKTLKDIGFQIIEITGTFNVKNKILSKIMKGTRKYALLRRYFNPGIVVMVKK